MKQVMYPGSFDPFTNGHLDLVKRASCLFDRVVVAVAVHSGKTPMFTLEERKNLAEECCRALPNVEVVSFDGLLADAVESLQVQAVLRGVRTFADFEYEKQMALMNRSMRDCFETVFMLSSSDKSFISSSAVKEVARLGGAFERYVPPCVAEAVRRKLDAEKAEAEK